MLYSFFCLTKVLINMRFKYQKTQWGIVHVYIVYAVCIDKIYYQYY